MNEKDSLREDILKLCFDRYEGSFAGGQTANNKLDLERVSHVPALGTRVVDSVADLVYRFEPDLVVGTPRGANWLARETAKALGTRALTLHKDEATKEFSYLNGGEEAVLDSKRIIIVDDVLNRLTNTTKVYSLPGVADRTVAVAAIWDRNPGRNRLLPVPLRSVIVEEIPDILPEDDPRWEYAP